MRFSLFFIDRPIFAIVLSLLMLILGALALPNLPIAQYPEVVPPTVVVATRYAGANPQTIAETVAAPLEQEINGVENMLYLSSQSSADGSMQLNITFKIGTNLDIAQMQVQNRVANALPRLPEEVRRVGVTTTKRSPDLLLVIHLISPSQRYDQLYLANYAILNLRDALNRVNGVGEARVFGAGEYSMRVWLNPEQLASRNLTASDVTRALREQNVQVAAGVLGQPPDTQAAAFQLTVNATGRFTRIEDFEALIVKTGANGVLVHLRDVARIELGGASYALRSLLNGEDATAIPIFLRPGANALQTAQNIKDTMRQLKTRFPEGVDYRIVYDTTIFVEESIRAVIITFIEALLLVVVVVIVFLQTWRAALIPLAAVPISIIGTFALMHWMGFSINTLSLFGLVLAIGIVVDDAIVVVENVERHIANGLAPRAAARQAMLEVSGPIIAISLVLIAVFVPAALVSGIDGQFYRQFALTIAASTLISAINSLTLSPALAALLLQPHHAKSDLLTRLLNLLFGWFFRAFNWIFTHSAHGYAWLVSKILRISFVMLLLYAGLLALTYEGFKHVPQGFIPAQDKGYLIAVVQLPEAASLERTDAVMRSVSKMIKEIEGVSFSVGFSGLSVVSFSNLSNAGTIFIGLEDFKSRKERGLSADRITGTLYQKLGGVQEAFIAVFPPPPILGLGSLGGFKLQVQDRGNEGLDALNTAVTQIMAKANATPGLTRVFTTYQNAVPQVYVDIDRSKAKTQDIALTELFETLQINLGSLYVNDINLFGRTYQVIVQADAPYRLAIEDIRQLKTRNGQGDMVPLAGLLEAREISGPNRVVRYNLAPAIEINGAAAPGYSSGQAIALMEDLLARELPVNMGYEWTELTYLQILAGNNAIYVFALSVLVVFLVLAALYESWLLPLAIILIVPMTLLFAISGLWLLGGDNNLFTQVAFLVLVGLASKNAILLVEFAKYREDEGQDRFQAAIEACRLRLRPILMTSFAFIMGVIPLMTATGAGAEMRQALGTPVFFGMLGVTLFGLLLTPVFYVLLRAYAQHKAPAPHD